ncbi:sel1 repeat family protein [Shewanella avicenniae]|uniref:Sel1 repeat family protein n=1 Tax=Shewanella avicenniae TaxID=2814294 RepID=A0ABX7QU84_9GAMM|nr:tetratricopeptide repeat protein [Shewanella avicenniae]QSX34408.1 sel1 repeat family protein [Shewanella avicenniae]
MLRSTAALMLLFVVLGALLMMQPSPRHFKQLQLADFYLFSSPQQLQLAQHYWDRHSSDYSPELAEKWFVRAAKNGEAEAHYQLAHLYYIFPNLSGLEWEANVLMATDELEHAANSGMLKAQTELADILFKHDNTPDKIRGLDFLARAAKQNDVKAMMQLGRRYCTDPDVQNFTLGKQYLTQAAEAGDKQAPLMLASFYQQGRCGDADLAQYRYWIEKSATDGNVEAMQQLAAQYLQGDGRSQDLLQAALWLYRAQQPDALYQLGMLFQQQPELFTQVKQQVSSGFVAESNYADSIVNCFYLATEQGHPKAAFAFGVLNLEHKDNELAMQAFKIAKDAGYPKFAAQLGDEQAKKDVQIIKANDLQRFFELQG